METEVKYCITFERELSRLENVLFAVARGMRTVKLLFIKVWCLLAWHASLGSCDHVSGMVGADEWNCMVKVWCLLYMPSRLLLNCTIRSLISFSGIE